MLFIHCFFLVRNCIDLEIMKVICVFFQIFSVYFSVFVIFSFTQLTLNVLPVVAWTCFFLRHKCFSCVPSCHRIVHSFPSVIRVSSVLYLLTVPTSALLSCFCSCNLG